MLLLVIPVWIISSMLKLFTYQCWQSFEKKIPIGDIKWCSHATAQQKPYSTSKGNNEFILYWQLTFFFRYYLYIFLSVSLVSPPPLAFISFLLLPMVYMPANILHRISPFLMLSDLSLSLFGCPSLVWKGPHGRAHALPKNMNAMSISSVYIIWRLLYLCWYRNLCISFYPAIWWIYHNWITLAGNVFYRFSPHWGG